MVALAAETILERTRLFRRPALADDPGRFRPCRSGVPIAAVLWCFHRKTPAMPFTAWSRARFALALVRRTAGKCSSTSWSQGIRLVRLRFWMDGPAPLRRVPLRHPRLIVIVRDHFLALLEREPKLVSHVVQASVASAFGGPAGWPRTQRCWACRRDWRANC